MLSCYRVLTSWASGAQVVPFLVRMARVTKPAGSWNPIPYPLEATAESWKEEDHGPQRG